MLTLCLKKLTDVSTGSDVWVNPAHVTHVAGFRHYDTRGNTFEVRGTLLHLAGDAYTLHVKESPSYVVAALQSGKGGVCRDCSQILEERWATLCADCAHARTKAAA